MLGVCYFRKDLTPQQGQKESDTYKGKKHNVRGSKVFTLNQFLNILNTKFLNGSNFSMFIDVQF